MYLTLNKLSYLSYLIPWEPNTAKKHIESVVFVAKIVPVLTTLCMLSLKFLELFCTIL